MIDFNTKDDNIPQIAEKAAFGSFFTKNTFRVYGLSLGKQNRPIMISLRNSAPEKIAPLVEFFKLNGLACEVESNDNDKVYVGLRKDLRENVDLASCVVKTVVYFFEDKLDLSKPEKVGGIPVFPETVNA